MASLDIIIPIAIVAIVFSGFMIRLFRNNWKKPFSLLSDRVQVLETKQKTSEANCENMTAGFNKDIQKVCDDIAKLRAEMMENLKALEKEYKEALDDREDRIAERISEQSRRIEKLDDHLREVSKELIQVARFWNDPQHYRIQK
ncbi:MAG: hypothetical protein M0R77_02480 [Gammaproteobacteria bacterium]|nr:hypothetical protein [Gammaproteobacteria bacterium]